MRAILLLFIGCLLAFRSHADKPISVVKYMGNGSSISEGYYLDIIEAALKETENRYGPYRIDLIDGNIMAMRRHIVSAEGKLINIERITGFKSEPGPRQSLLLVDYPLLRGLMSYRILLIQRDVQERFNTVKNLDDLRKFSMGLCKGWEGFAYQRSGFNVTEPYDFDTLLKMLAGGRYDFVPLGSIEILDNYTVDGQPLSNLTPEKNLLVYIPLPMYFYVSPTETVLAERLKIGFEEMEKYMGKGI